MSKDRIPRSRRLMERTRPEPVTVQESSARTQGGSARDELIRISPLAVLDAVREDPWGIHAPKQLSQQFLVTVLRLRSSDPSKSFLSGLTGRCGKPDELARWLQALRRHTAQSMPVDGAIELDTARGVLTALAREDLSMVSPLLRAGLLACPASPLLRVLEVWVGAEKGALGREDALFALASLPLDSGLPRRLAGVIQTQGPRMGPRRRALAQQTLNGLGG